MLRMGTRRAAPSLGLGTRRHGGPLLSGPTRGKGEPASTRRQASEGRSGGTGETSPQLRAETLSSSLVRQLSTLPVRSRKKTPTLWARIGVLSILGSLQTNPAIRLPSCPKVPAMSRCLYQKRASPSRRKAACSPFMAFWSKRGTSTRLLAVLVKSARRSEPVPRMVRGLRAAALSPLPNGLNIPSDLIQVRQVVTGQHSQHHAQGLRASLIVLAGALQIRR